MKRIIIILSLFAALRPAAPATLPASDLTLVAYDPSEKPIKRVLTAGSGYSTGSGIKVSFLEYIPAPNPNGEKHPLIIFLHGQGERGIPGDTSTSGGVVKLYNTRIPSMIRYNDLPYFIIPGTSDTATYAVLAPQCSNSYGTWPLMYVWEMVKHAEANLSDRIDVNRIYVVGLSQGGGGAYNVPRDTLLARHIAGIVAVCPGYWPNGHALSAVAKTGVPTWVFHAANDGVATIANPDGYLTSLNGYAPLASIQYIRFTTGGHSIWDRIFDLDYGSYATTTGSNWDENETGRMWEFLLKYVNSPKRRPGIVRTVPLPTEFTFWFNPLNIAS